MLRSLNAPGTFHDITMVDYSVYDRMEKLYDTTDGKVVVDSAFNISTKYCLIKSAQKDPLDTHALLINHTTASIRKLSDYDICMIKNHFPRLKGSLKYKEEGDIMVISRLIVNLYSFHCFCVGINQIQNSYTNKLGFWAQLCRC